MGDALQVAVLLITIANSLALALGLFILTDMRERISRLENFRMQESPSQKARAANGG